MSSQPAVKPRKIPSQQRARSTVDNILEASAHLLRKEGYEAFTTNRVAETAGYSIGSLYQYFPNKAALLTALWNKHHRELSQELAKAFAAAGNLPLREAVTELIEANIRAHQIDPELHRIMSRDAPEIIFNDPADEGLPEMYSLMRAFLVDRSKEIRPDLNIEPAIKIIQKLVETITHDTIMEGSSLTNEAALIEEMTSMIVAYLTREAANPC